VKKKPSKTKKQHKKAPKPESDSGRSGSSQAHRDWQLLSEIASALPLPNPDLEQDVMEHLNRCKRIGIRIARRVGVEDPEAVFFEAYGSILKSPKPGPKKWPFLPKRIKDRAISAYRRQMRRSSGVPTVPIDESRALAIESPMVRPELPWLAEAWRPALEPLNDLERQFIVLFHFLEWPIARIASVRTFGSTQSAAKTRLHRIRKKLQAIPYRPQPSAD
jgi:DNA-directed RNA polymerase specialized sigma24 family protein